MTANIPQPVPPAGPGPLRQFEIYLQGAMAGAKPAVPIAFAELERQAREKLAPEAYAYIACGAGFEHTVEENTAAFARWRIVPRMLRDVAARDLSIELFGRKLATPLLVAPIGVQELAHKDADLATAKAAAAERVPMIFYNQASVQMETMAQAMGDQPRWFQLYWSKSDELVASLVRRAEACGCDAIVVTLDTTLLGWRTRDLDYAYLPFIRGMGLAQYTSDPAFRAMLKKPPEEDMLAAAQLFMTIYSNPALTWDKLAFLRQHTSKPILLKGINRQNDARKALDLGIDGIVVSNHGGRQVDGARASLDALDEIARAVGGRLPLLFDSGIRGGAGIFKALALGATAVCIGRPYVYGLAIAGEAGVRAVLRNMIADLDLTMGTAGCASIKEINRDMLARV
ncbi:MAG: lactate 2-monooxygenase [Methylobacteriaceae bacterium]|nr:lactate 2-monooxygenase [Methylobacteriaceae bacterium]